MADEEVQKYLVESKMLGNIHVKALSILNIPSSISVPTLFKQNYYGDMVISRAVPNIPECKGSLDIIPLAILRWHGKLNVIDINGNYKNEHTIKYDDLAPSLLNKMQSITTSYLEDNQIGNFTGSMASEDGTHGKVIPPLIENRKEFLKADGTWETPKNTECPPASDTTMGILKTYSDGGSSTDGGMMQFYIRKLMRDTIVIPPADVTTGNTGIIKLYSSLGNHVDGALTQITFTHIINSLDVFTYINPNPKTKGVTRLLQDTDDMSLSESGVMSQKAIKDYLNNKITHLNLPQKATDTKDGILRLVEDIGNDPQAAFTQDHITKIFAPEGENYTKIEVKDGALQAYKVNGTIESFVVEDIIAALVNKAGNIPVGKTDDSNIWIDPNDSGHMLHIMIDDTEYRLPTKTLITDLSYFSRNNVPNYRNITSYPSNYMTKFVNGVNNSGNRDTVYVHDAFSGCSAVTSLSIGRINTNHCPQFSNMFYNCTALTHIDVSMDFGSVLNKTDAANMFTGCNNLVSGSIQFTHVKSSVFSSASDLIASICGGATTSTIYTNLSKIVTVSSWIS